MVWLPFTIFTVTVFLTVVYFDFFAVTVIFTEPGFFPVTTPFELTVATDLLDDL